MSKLSLIEKLNILFKTSIDSKLPFVFLALLIFIGIFLFKTNKKNEKTVPKTWGPERKIEILF